MLRKEAIGGITGYNAGPRQFSTENILFVEAVAHLGAIALGNTRLYEAVKKDYEAFREEMLEWRAALGQEWIVEKAVVPAEEQLFFAAGWQPQERRIGIWI